MSPFTSMPACFESRANLVMEMFADEFHLQLTCDLDGVEQLSHYIELVRELMLPDQIEEAVTSLGAFLGQAIIKGIQGEWSHENDWWGVQITSGIIACPFVQVRNQLVVGHDQSVSRYYSCLQWLVAHLRVPAPDALHDPVMIEQLKSELEIWLEIERNQTTGKESLAAGHHFTRSTKTAREAI